jgi:hypothetical protein
MLKTFLIAQVLNVVMLAFTAAWLCVVALWAVL